MKPIIPVLLCGGYGRRLWPLSTKNLPKQFIRIYSDNLTSFQRTALRISSSPIFDTIIIVTISDFEDLIIEQMKECGITRYHILSENNNFGTAQSIYNCINFIKFLKDIKCNDIPIAFFPVDSYIEDEISFMNQISFKFSVAIESAEFRNEFIFSCGTLPDTIDNAYGYIKIGKHIRGMHLFSTNNFIEKPKELHLMDMIKNNILKSKNKMHTLNTQKIRSKRGNKSSPIDDSYLVNIGIYLASLSAFLKNFNQKNNYQIQNPKFTKKFSNKIKKNTNDSDVKNQAYSLNLKENNIQIYCCSLDKISENNNISFDKLIIENIQKLCAIYIDCKSFLDIGTWTNLINKTNDNNDSLINSDELNAFQAKEISNHNLEFQSSNKNEKIKDSFNLLKVKNNKKYTNQEYNDEQIKKKISLKKKQTDLDKSVEKCNNKKKKYHKEIHDSNENNNKETIKNKIDKDTEQDPHNKEKNESQKSKDKNAALKILSKNSFVYSKTKPIIMIGVDSTIAVELLDFIIIANIKQLEEIKGIISSIKNKKNDLDDFSIQELINIFSMVNL